MKEKKSVENLKNKESNKNAWLKYTDADLKKVEKLSEGYKEFISDCKTERECALEVIRQAEKEGYKDLMTLTKVKPGDKVYFNNMDKAVALFLVGSEPLEKGMKLLGAHIDSPRIDLKQVPLY